MACITVCDTTLRDGEQMPGVVFSQQEKLELAFRIADFGCGIIELMPAVSKQEAETAKHLAEAGLEKKLTASTLARPKDIEIALDCGIKHLTLFSSLSDIHLKHKLDISREKNLENALKAVDLAKSYGFRVSFAGEDATRANLSYAIEFIKAMEKKIEYFLPCDTLGCLTALQTADFIKTLKKTINCPICLHCHNDFGLAVANTLAGIEAGAEMFMGTFTGIGERSGNAAIEEVCTALQFLSHEKLKVKFEKLTEICQLIEQYSGVAVQAHKPIIGRNAFCHESGVHVDGVIKHAANYEPFKPEFVGQERSFSFGKHSGKSILRHVFKDSLSEKTERSLLSKLKFVSEEKKRSLSEQEVLALLHRV